MLALMLRRLFVYQLVLKYISVNNETWLSVYQISFVKIWSALMLLLLLLIQLLLKYISDNLETSIGLSISFKMYKR